MNNYFTQIFSSRKDFKKVNSLYKESYLICSFVLTRHKTKDFYSVVFRGGFAPFRVFNNFMDYIDHALIRLVLLGFRFLKITIYERNPFRDNSFRSRFKNTPNFLYYGGNIENATIDIPSNDEYFTYIPVLEKMFKEKDYMYKLKIRFLDSSDILECKLLSESEKKELFFKEDTPNFYVFEGVSWDDLKKFFLKNKMVLSGGNPSMRQWNSNQDYFLSLFLNSIISSNSKDFKSYLKNNKLLYASYLKDFDITYLNDYFRSNLSITTGKSVEKHEVRKVTKNSDITSNDSMRNEAIQSDSNISNKIVSDDERKGKLDETLTHSSFIAEMILAIRAFNELNNGQAFDVEKFLEFLSKFIYYIDEKLGFRICDESFIVNTSKYIESINNIYITEDDSSQIYYNNIDLALKLIENEDKDRRSQKDNFIFYMIERILGIGLFRELVEFVKIFKKMNTVTRSVDLDQFKFFLAKKKSVIKKERNNFKYNKNINIEKLFKLLDNNYISKYFFNDPILIKNYNLNLQLLINSINNTIHGRYTIELMAINLLSKTVYNYLYDKLPHEIIKDLDAFNLFRSKIIEIDPMFKFERFDDSINYNLIFDDDWDPSDSPEDKKNEWDGYFSPEVLGKEGYYVIRVLTGLHIKNKRMREFFIEDVIGMLNFMIVLKNNGLSKTDVFDKKKQLKNFPLGKTH